MFKLVEYMRSHSHLLAGTSICWCFRAQPLSRLHPGFFQAFFDLRSIVVDCTLRTKGWRAVAPSVAGIPENVIEGPKETEAKQGRRQSAVMTQAEAKAQATARRLSTAPTGAGRTGSVSVSVVESEAATQPRRTSMVGDPDHWRTFLEHKPRQSRNSRCVLVHFHRVLACSRTTDSIYSTGR